MQLRLVWKEGDAECGGERGCVYNGGCGGASFIIFTFNVKEQDLAGTSSPNFGTESQASELFSPDRKKNEHGSGRGDTLIVYAHPEHRGSEASSPIYM